MIVLSVAVPAIAWGPPPPLVYLDVASSNPWVVPLEGSSAWPITLNMTVRERDIIGIGTPYGPPFLPPKAGPGYLVFEDPDACPSFIPFQFDSQELAYLTYYCPGQGSMTLEYPGCIPPDWRPYLDYDCPSDVPSGLDWFSETEAVEAANPGLLRWAKDETWLEFSAGISVAPWVHRDDPNKENGPQEVWASVACEPEDPPTCVNGHSWHPQYVGPNLGYQNDPIRFGRSPRLPGLVILADHGPGLLTTPLDYDNPPPNPTTVTPPRPSEFFDPVYPAEAWNLAGLFNSVGFTFLNNATAPVGWGRLKLQAHLNVPPALFTPVVLVDRIIDNPVMIDGVLCGEEWGQALYRMDGGPLSCLDQLGTYYSVDPLVNPVVVTVRAFLVDGDAPDIVADMDGNGLLDINDVIDMGYTPLSWQQAIRFRQLHELESGHPYDFDGNGEAGGPVLGARAGGITGVPR
jgi:hypothetical protein